MQSRRALVCFFMLPFLLLFSRLTALLNTFLPLARESTTCVFFLFVYLQGSELID